MPTFFKRQKPAERQEKEKRAEQSPIGEEPERLYVNPYGKIETIEEWAKRNGITHMVKDADAPFIEIARMLYP